MKSIEELAVTSSDLSALFPKIIMDVEAAARERRIGRQLVKVNTDLQRMKGRTLTVPYRSRIAYSGTTAVGYVAEGTTPTEVKATYTTVAVTVTKIGAFFKITQETIDAVNIDVIKDQILEVGEALADFEDWMIMDELYGATVATMTLAGCDAANGTYTLTQTGILSVDEVRLTDSAGTLQTLTYLDFAQGQTLGPGRFIISENVSSASTLWIKYKYSARSNLKGAALASTGAWYETILKGRTEMVKLKYHPNFAVLAYDQEQNLLTDERFIDTSRYGTSTPIQNGEIGKAASLRLINCMHGYVSAVLFLDTTRAAWLVIKRNVDMKTKDVPEEDSYAHYFYQELIPAVIHEDAVVLVGLGFVPP